MQSYNDLVEYLNLAGAGPALFHSKLYREIEALKQPRAPASQWINTIKGLTQKGVKQTEIDEIGILLELETWDRGKPIPKETVLEILDRYSCTVKQVTLAQPQWPRYRWPGGEYHETLFIANSQKANLIDRVEEIDFELEQINFELERLDEVLPLSTERERLYQLMERAQDFTHHHFSTAVNGKHGKNLLAHARYTLRDSVFFVEEIQSDWAQRGRQNEWQTIPRGPFVTNTEIWTNLVLRRLMQIAAQRGFDRFAWISSDMRNGGNFSDRDSLSEFYARIVPKLVEKIAGKGARVTAEEIQLGSESKTVLGLNITPEIRERLSASQPLYAHGRIGPLLHSDPEEIRVKAAVLKREFRAMTGDVAELQLLAGMMDDAYSTMTGEAAVGSYGDRMVRVSLAADDPHAVLRHETMHLALEHLLPPSDRECLLRAFAADTALSSEITELTGKHYGGRPLLACRRSDEERICYAFQLWSQKRLSLSSQASGEFTQARNVFERFAQVCQRLWEYVRNQVRRGNTTPEKIFRSLAAGAYAMSNELRSADSAMSRAPRP